MLQLIPIVTPVQKQAEEFIMWVERAYRSNLQVQRKTPIDRFDLHGMSCCGFQEKAN